MEKVSYKIKEMPKTERPRERLQAVGAQVLGNRELLAILIGQGRKDRNALQLADDILIRFGEVGGLAGLRISELTGIDGIGPGKASTILAAIELGRRVYEPQEKEKEYVRNPQAVADLFMQSCTNKKKEEFWILLVDAKLRVYAKERISEGTLTQSLVHPREVFTQAIRQAAHGIILVHNHPSGDPKPSPEDFNITARLEECGEVIGITVLDHVVIGNGNYYSFKEHGDI